METIQQINIKNRTYYFYSDIINLDEFDESRIRIDKKDFNHINIYYLGYEYKKKTSECNVTNSVNPLYLRIKNMNGQFEKGKDDAWYLVMSIRDLQIFLKILKIKLQKKHEMLYNMIMTA